MLIGLEVALAFGLVGGPVVGLIVAIVRWTQVPLDVARATSPRATVRDDRLTMLFGLAGCWLVIPLAIALIVFGVSALDANLGWLRAGSVAALALSLFLSMLILPVVGLLMALRRPWPYYSVARILLALSGRLPWRLMAFLEDAHRLGLLRQVGSAYQFRHARLLDHLSLTPVLGNAGAEAGVEVSSVRPAIGVEGLGCRTDSTPTNDEC